MNSVVRIDLSEGICLHSGQCRLMCLMTVHVGMSLLDFDPVLLRSMNRYPSPVQ